MLFREQAARQAVMMTSGERSFSSAFHDYMAGL